MQSPNVSNSFADIAQAQFQASLQFADTMFSGVERIDQVLLDNAHQLISDELHYARTLVAERDSKEVSNKQLTFFSGTPDAAMKYQDALFRAYSQIQKDLSACWQQYTQQIGEQITEQIGRQASMLSETGKLSNVQRDDALFGPITSMLSAWQSAWQSAYQSVIPDDAERSAQTPQARKLAGDAPSPAARSGRHPAASDQRRTGARQG